MPSRVVRVSVTPARPVSANTDEAADVALTLRWSFEDLKAEHGEPGARRILAEILARWDANGGEPVALDDA